jgi:hypothetical protein
MTVTLSKVLWLFQMLLNHRRRNEKSSVLRHAFVEVSPVSVVKIEMIEKSVFLNNEFSVSYFIGNKLYDKKFILKRSQLMKKPQKKYPFYSLKESLR